MTGDPWETFQTSGTAERLRMIAEPATRESLRPHLGDAAVQAYLRLAEGLPRGTTLGEEHPPNLVFVPGVMGSVLVSSGLGGVWWLDVRSRRRLDQLGLTPDGAADATTGARISPAAVDATYDSFCAAAIARNDVGHVTFPYDWRRPVPSAAERLGDVVLGTFEQNGHRPVHLVAHSMGGLVVREALRQEPALWDRVGRIVFLGTPHYGAPAIAGYLKNHLWGFELLALLGRYLSRSTFRSLWGVLDLLPAPPGVYSDTRADDQGWRSHPCANFDLYDAAAYRLGLDAAEQARLQRGLDAASAFHTTLARWHRDLPQEHRDRMLVVAGVGFRTLFSVRYEPAFGFLWEHMDRVTTRRPGDRHREGDGRVPLASAQLEYVGDIRYVRAEHGRLPAVPAVQSAVFDWLRGAAPNLPATPAAALAATLGADLDAGAPSTSAPGALPGADDDPGYLDVDPVADEVLDGYDAAADAGRLAGFDRIKVL